MNFLYMSCGGSPCFWRRRVELIHQSAFPEIKLEDVELHVAAAMSIHPILNEARLEILGLILSSPIFTELASTCLPASVRNCRL